MTDRDGTQLTTEEMMAEFGIGVEAVDSRESDQRLAVTDLHAESEQWAERPETAFRVDEWHEYKAKSIIENEDYQGLWKAEVDTVDEHGKPTTKEVELSPDANMVADCYSAAFEIEPHLNSVCQDEQRRAFFEALLQTEDYRALHKRTQLDSTAAELASLYFAQQIVEIRVDTQCNGNPSHADPGRQQFLNDMRNASHAAKAAQSASQTVNAYDEACDALGSGSETGGNGKMDSKTLGKLFQQVRASEQLKRICELAGKYRRVAQNAQRRKVNHGMDDVVGVELSGDIGRSLPSELAMLADPELEDLVLRRIVDAGIMCRKHEGVDHVAKGPVMFFVDESGSMSGEKSYNGKALGLALAWVAQKQKRWFCLNAFSGYSRSGNPAHIADELHQLRTVVIPPGKSMMGPLMEWMLEFQNGGTTVEFLHRDTITALYAKTKAAVGKTDIILLTDGEVCVSEATRNTFNAWKKESQTTLHTIIIPPGDEKSLECVSDRVYRLDRLDFTQDGVGDVLSI